WAFGTAIAGVAKWLPFLVNAVSYLLCLSTLSAMRFADKSDDGTAAGAAPTGIRMLDGGPVVWRHPFLRTTTLIAGLVSMIAQMAILVMLVQTRAGGSPAWVVGLVLGAGGLGGVIGSAVAPGLLRLCTVGTVVRGALWVWTCCLLPFAFTADPRALTACWGGVGVVGAVFGVALTTVRMHIVPDEVLGRAYAAMATWNAGAAAAGPLAGGYLISWLGLGPTRIILSAAMCCTAVIGLHPSTIHSSDLSRPETVPAPC
ncbi:MAG: hypothetical protein HOQ24_07305, partial [Mycobacteriaceae bacterium]|nr:hypothetical protein [Mycobacteriaceae bacterium]